MCERFCLEREIIMRCFIFCSHTGSRLIHNSGIVAFFEKYPHRVQGVVPLPENPSRTQTAMYALANERTNDCNEWISFHLSVCLSFSLFHCVLTILTSTKMNKA